MKSTEYSVAFAQAQGEREAAQNLRYRVFVQEMGGNGPFVDHENQLERDRFDDACEHLILWHHQTGNEPEAVGVYRLLSSETAKITGGFYSAAEFDLDPLVRSNKKMIEVGRSCLHENHRGGAGMLLLWSALARHVFESETEFLFGVASFQGSDPEEYELALDFLNSHHLAPDGLRPIAKSPNYFPKSRRLFSPAERRAAMAHVPALLKAYLRLGGGIGQGAYLDHDFGTTDVCVVLETASISPLQREIYMKGLNR